LESEKGIQAVKTRGLRVIRAVVTKTSRLIGQTAAEVDFRERYKAAIVAVQKGGRNVALSTVRFGSGDVLVLQASDDSSLLKVTPADFYKRLNDPKDNTPNMSRTSSVSSLVNILTRTKSSVSVDKHSKTQAEENLQESGAADDVEAAQSTNAIVDEFFIESVDAYSDDGGPGTVVELAALELSGMVRSCTYEHISLKAKWFCAYLAFSIVGGCRFHCRK
jgi:hypothetical protein